MTAVIHDGYYLIGRHPECQIRPKSKSVSRRHCLIHHAAGEVRVFDLQSTSGTIVNATRLDPKQWRKLKDDDQLRLGKVVFRLSISTGQAAEKVVARNFMSAGEAWHDVDVASFLDAEDEADRKQRYRNIREGRRSESFSENRFDEAGPETDSDFDTLIDSVEETFADETFAEETDASTQRAPKKKGKAEKGKANQNKADQGKSGKGKANVKAKAKPKKPKQPSRLPKLKSAKAARTRAGFAFSLSSLRDAEQLKLICVVLIAVSVLGFFGYRVYQFSSPAPLRVVEELKY